ncbi:murein DD-endopeptidase MepM/ murein hydrolase activator NlpD [Methylorubrum pseudosasae]|nr:murein DD-endopeptidase MepM/ murein hydrolase activator NlpD [Methylorubrum pseudosasae]
MLVVPENVTKLAKVELRPGEAPLVEERDLALKRGETLDGALKATGQASDPAIAGIVAALGGKAKVAALSEGQQFRVQFAPGPKPGDGRQVTRVVLFGETGVQAIAAINDHGAFVPVAPPVDETRGRNREQAQAETPDDDEEDEGSGPRLYQSLYETGARHDVPRPTIEDIIRIFSYDIDFQRRISSGDGIDLFYTYDEEAGPAAAERPELLYAALNLGGESRKVYRFQSPDDGSIDYLDEQGRSLKKFLIRKPIADGIMRSGFGYRRHPILGYAKLHTGVDWANPIGTPIVAAGNGTVIKAEWDSGYGRRVEVQHINGYVTTYNHMSPLRPRGQRGQPRPAGTGDRLRRLDRPLHRRAPALRGDHQRALRRSDEDPRAAWSRARRTAARRVQAPARPDRGDDAEIEDRHGDGAARRDAVRPDNGPHPYLCSSESRIVMRSSARRAV